MITGDKSVATPCFAERVYTAQSPCRAYRDRKTPPGIRCGSSTTWLPQRRKDVIVHNVPPCSDNSFLMTFPPPEMQRPTTSQSCQQRGRPWAEDLRQKSEVGEQDFSHSRTAGHSFQHTSRETSKDSSLALSHCCQNTRKQRLTFVFP